MEVFAHIGRAQRELICGFSSALATAEAPLEVLRELFVDSKCSLRPEMISAALGILEESVGGDLLRHPSSERHTLFGRGGFMYQPSEPHELWQIFTVLNLKPGSLFVDLGSGYGHVVFQGAITRPDVRFKGIELMPVRVSECEGARVRHRISNLSFVAADVTEGGFADADILFLFNPFPPDTKGAVAEHIESLAKSRPLAVLDYEGVATQAISNMVPVAVKDVAPYRVVCSRRFLAESCDLIGIRPPPQARR
jgi:SAM-dependent methyltransferase